MIRRLKHAALTQLARVGLLRPTYRAYERLRAVGAGDGVATGDEFPAAGEAEDPRRRHPRLRLVPRERTAGGGGDAGAARARRLQLEEFEAVLDFGCGCGRVTRHLATLPGQVHGSDMDADGVAWCRANLTFGRFERNGLAPPLALPAESVDFAYALSVLTHLPVDLQESWMHELTRVLRPGGLLVVTTHGERYLSRLSASEQERFLAGEVVVRFEQVAGTNLCTAFHPQADVTGRLARGLELLDAIPDGAAGNPHQDLFLLRKPATASRRLGFEREPRARAAAASAPLVGDHSRVPVETGPQAGLVDADTGRASADLHRPRRRRARRQPRRDGGRPAVTAMRGSAQVTTTRVERFSRRDRDRGRRSRRLQVGEHVAHELLDARIDGRLDPVAVHAVAVERPAELVRARAEHAGPRRRLVADRLGPLQVDVAHVLEEDRDLQATGRPLRAARRGSGRAHG